MLFTIKQNIPYSEKYTLSAKRNMPTLDTLSMT